MTCQLTNLHALYINCWHLNTTCSEYTEEKEQSLPGTLSSSKYSSRDESLNLLPCTNKKPPQVSWYDRPWWAFVAAVPYHCVWPARDDLACAVDAPSSAATAAVTSEETLVCPSVLTRTWWGAVAWSSPFTAGETESQTSDVTVQLQSLASSLS